MENKISNQPPDDGNYEQNIVSNAELLKLLQGITDSSLDIVQVFKAVRNEQGEITDFTWILINKTSEELYGDVIGKSLLTLQPVVVTEGIFDTFKKVVETGDPDQSMRYYVHEQFNGWFLQSAVKHGDGVAVTAKDISNVKRAEQELEQSRALLQSTIDALDISIAVYKAVRNNEGQIIDFLHDYINYAGKSMLGEDWTGRLFTEHGENALLQMPQFLEVMATGKSQNYIREANFRGSKVWFAITNTFLDSGRLVHTWEDITERKNAEEQTRAAKELVQTVFDVTINPIAYHKAVRDNAGQIVDFEFQLENEKARQYSLGDRTGQRYSEAYPGIRNTIVFEKYCEVVETGNALNTEVQIDLKGRNHWFHLMAAKLDDGLVATAIDITERKKAEQEIKDQADFISSVLNAASAIVSITNPAGDILFSNRDAFTLLGFDADEIARLKREDRMKFVHPDDKLLLRNFYASLDGLQDGMEAAVQYRMKNKAEQYLWLDTRTKILKRDETGKASQFLYITHDITAQKKAEQEILRLKDQIAQKAEDKYRTLFNSINQGFSIIEPIFDDGGRVTDYWHREHNPVFTKLTGIENAVGKRMSELVSYIEPQWHQVIEQTYYTGRSVQVEYPVQVLGKWFRTYLSRVGEGSPLIACVYDDITDSKLQELQQNFLLRLSDELRTLTTAETIASHALKMLFEQLRLDRCYMGVYRLNEDRLDFIYEVGNDKAPAVPAGVRFSDFPDVLRIALEGTLVMKDVAAAEGLNDVDKENLIAMGMRSFVTASLRTGGNISLWSIVAVSASPRDWTLAEIQLIENVAERAWAAIERAKAEDALRQSEEKYRNLFMSMDEGYLVADVIFNNNNEAVDIFFVEANAAAKRVAGRDFTNLRMAEIDPEYEARWYELYGRVALTGEPLHEVQYAKPHNQWFEFDIASIEGPDSRRVAVIFREITERKQNEVRQKLLLNISDWLGAAESLKDVQTIVTESLRAHYDAGWCYYVEWEEEIKAGVVQYDSKRDDLLSLAGTHDVSDVPEFLDLLKSGQIVKVSDYEEYKLLTPKIRDRYTAAGFRSMLVASLIRQGRLISSLIIGDTKKRNWTCDDETLLADAAERTWAAVERAKAEEALRESKKRFQSIANLVPDLLWDSEPDGETSWYNQRWLEYTGQSFEQATGWGWVDAIHPDDREVSAKRYSQAVVSGEPLLQEHRIRRHDGEYRWFVINASPLKNQENHVIKMYGSATDINDRKQAEEALRKSEEKYRTIFETIDEGFTIQELITDENDKVIDILYLEANKAFELHTGVKDVVGKKASELFPHLEQDWLDTMSNVYKTGEPLRNEGYQADLNRWITAQYSRVGGQGSKLLSVVFEDITKNKQNEQRQVYLLKHIILVDDDLAIQDAVRMVLEQKGYAVTAFASGSPILSGGFEYADLFILDRQLPGVDGLDICRLLKSQTATRQIPVLMLSASPHVASQAKAAGADDFLEKPFKINHLREIVEDLLNKIG